MFDTLVEEISKEQKSEKINVSMIDNVPFHLFGTMLEATF